MTGAIVAGYCDGGLIVAPGQAPGLSPHGGTWAYRLVGEDTLAIREDSGVLSAHRLGGAVGNNTAEYAAAVKLLEALPPRWSGTVYTDSKNTIGRLRDGWATNGIPDWLRDRAQLALLRLGTLAWVLLDGHPTRAQLAAGVGKRGNPVSEHNVWCDQACQAQARRWLATYGPRLGLVGEGQHVTKAPRAG